MFDYFVGGEPAGTIYTTKVADLHEIVRRSAWSGLSFRVTEVCSIGLIAYFEAFCKDHFASLINLCPQLLGPFGEHERDTTIDSAYLLSVGGDPKRRLGSLLSEKYDFGTAKHVNSLYFDLLGVTPFSKVEKREYDKLLNDRNLLVHHGGTYTLKYAKQTSVKLPLEAQENTFRRTLFVEKGAFHPASSLLTGIADKTCRATREALDAFIDEHDVKLPKEAGEALEHLVRT